GGGASSMAKSSNGTVNVCLIGQKFMGRTHSNAYGQVGRFFDPAVLPVMHTICGRDERELNEFKTRWGWQHASTDWKKAIKDPAIGLVDIGTPNHLHAEMAIAALEAGKHVACEKPLAGTLADARQMVEAAKKTKKQQTFVWYNYRRVPAVALAHQLAKDGKLGKIQHVRAWYLQDWGGPGVPLLWRFQKKFAGSGAHGDLNAHIVDMARFITGDEITEVSGAIAETFVKERDIPSSGPAGGITAGTKGGGGTGGAKKGKSDVDDAVLFLARFKGGAVASFEATRLATGNQNKNGIEINGDKGSVRFNFEDMNYLEYYDANAERRVQGWTKIMVTPGGDHPYVGNWWPDAHIIGYEHGFTNMVFDMMTMLGGKKPIVPMPDFEDAFKTQQVLEAAIVSAENRTPVKIAEMK
ncbi:MAG: Gfo/Idh/MocA family oxidoreductase, partial [Tepidisphaeraceae bacterium]